MKERLLRKLVSKKDDNNWASDWIAGLFHVIFLWQISVIESIFHFLIHLGQVVSLWSFKLYKCGYLYHADMFYQSEGGSQNFLWLKENNQKWEKKVTRMTQQNKGGINNKLAADSGGIRNWSLWIHPKTFIFNSINCPNDRGVLQKGTLQESGIAIWYCEFNKWDYDIGYYSIFLCLI